MLIFFKVLPQPNRRWASSCNNILSCVCDDPLHRAFPSNCLCGRSHLQALEGRCGSFPIKWNWQHLGAVCQCSIKALRAQLLGCSLLWEIFLKFGCCLVRFLQQMSHIRLWSCHSTWFKNFNFSRLNVHTNLPAGQCHCHFSYLQWPLCYYATMWVGESPQPRHNLISFIHLFLINLWVIVIQIYLHQNPCVISSQCLRKY